MGPRAFGSTARRRSAVVAAIGLLCVGAVLLGAWWRTTSPAARPAEASPDGLAAPLPPVHVHPVAPQVPVVQRGIPANGIRIPALNATGRIVQARTIDGVVVPPKNVGQVGLWDGSAALDAATGEVTIAGHVTWNDMGTFLFARLARMRPGQLIYTTTAAGRQQAWRVTAIEARSKAGPLDARAFRGASGPRSLALITCGGSYDRTSHSYSSNVYVFADPVTTAPTTSAASRTGA